MSGRRGWRIFILAGEPSGDSLGAQLMAGLRAEAAAAGVPEPSFTGVGGDDMAAEGLESLYALGRLSVMGFGAVALRLPDLTKALHETVAAAQAAQPDAVITIDSPDFSLRLQHALHESRDETGRPGWPRLIHYVAPSVWAWRPGRARKIAGYLDHLLTLLPFEPPYFERVGLRATFVGHPRVAAGIGAADGPGLARELALPRRARVLAVLPGSRRQELKQHLPIYRRTVAALTERYGAGGKRGLHVLMPTLPELEEGLVRVTADWPVPVHVIAGAAHRRFAAFAASEVALATSGTVALETALAGLPTVVAYRINGLFAALLRPFVFAPYAHVVNLTAGAMVVPERTQGDCRSDLLARDVATLLDDPAARQAQIDGVREPLATLRGPAESPGRTAAATVAAELSGAPDLATTDGDTP